MVSASETRGALEGCRLVLLRVVVGLVSRDAASGRRCRHAVPGAGEAYTYGSWRGGFDSLRPRWDVVDAIDATTASEQIGRPRRASCEGGGGPAQLTS